MNISLPAMVIFGGHFTNLRLETFWRKQGALADKQRAGTAASKQSRTVARAKSSADFGRTHTPSSHSPVDCSPDKRAAARRARQLSARETRGDHSRAGEPPIEVAPAKRCGTPI